MTPVTPLPEPRTFLDEVLVVCPRCSFRAVITNIGDAPRLTCGECGYVREGDEGTPRLTWSTVRQDGHEPAFGLALWLSTECCGRYVLWALNEPHLDYLEGFVASTNREPRLPVAAGEPEPVLQAPEVDAASQQPGRAAADNLAPAREPCLTRCCFEAEAAARPVTAADPRSPRTPSA